MKKNNDISNRKSNIELLRIIAIIMIIAHHYCLYGGWSKVSGLSINNAILDFLVIGGKIGVAIFVLISGYFGINSEFKIKKLIKFKNFYLHEKNICVTIHNAKWEKSSV